MELFNVLFDLNLSMELFNATVTGVDRSRARLYLLLRSLPHLPGTVQEGELNLKHMFSQLYLHLAHRKFLPIGHYQKLKRDNFYFPRILLPK